jgi:hypothetical protein
MIRLSGHLKLFECTLSKLLFDFFLEVDEFSFYFWINVSLALEWATCQGNDVTIRTTLLSPVVLLTVCHSLTHAIHIVTLG